MQQHGGRPIALMGGGTTKVGDLIPSEREIAKLFHASKIPVRQATQKLVDMGVLLRAWVYARMLGGQGMHRVEFAALNANYLAVELKKAGFDLAFPERRASHEFIVTLKKLKDATGVSAMDFAKRLLDYGYHAPTTYFPLLVPECLLIEPTETESRETLDGFIEAMKTIKHEAETSPDLVKGAPYSLPVRRLDDVKAARELDLAYKPAA
jgi:glycine dehydrogenase subunit 2